ncbi:MAG: ribosome biogenesis GTP-binding protein YihA/YsxC [Oscillospiraceae bacterium]|nr:YihA family ribosome biogenesis GTP-binding protein [Ruminococcus sp.]MDE6708319.1 ribosome biogenesis GTP-binding protein YihA/YsxC [Oscillospiraceae bacterium]
MKFQNTVFTGSYGKASQFPVPERMEFAFVGRSNVGKSSLINKLVNKKSLARVSAVPGKTATVNFYSVDEKIYFVDLPGYGYAKTSKSEQQRLRKLIFDYLQADRDLQLVIQLLDMRHAPSVDDLNMINQLIDSEIPFIIVFTKADKLNKTERQNRMLAFANEIPCFEDICNIAVSVKNSEGLEDLQNIFSEIIEGDS